MDIKFYHLVAIVAMFQAFFLAFFLITNPRVKSTGNYLLAMFFIVFSIVAFSAFACSAHVWIYFINYHKYIFVGSQLALLSGPLMFLFIKSLNNPEFKLKPVHFLHLVPYLIFSVIIVICLTQIKEFAIPTSNLRFYSSSLILIQSLVYMIFSVIEVLKFNKANNNKLPLIRQKWIYILIGGFALFWVAKFNMFVLIDLQKIAGICPFTSSTYSISIFAFLSIFFYYAISNPELLFISPKYKNSKLEETLKNEIIIKLKYYMKTEKPHLNTLITLSMLAKELNVSARDLSQVINERMHQNFYEFINYQRIEESKQLLLKSSRNDKYISEIFYQVGFNSKSSFNVEFKKYTGTTPTEFRNSFLIKNSSNA